MTTVKQLLKFINKNYTLFRYMHHTWGYIDIKFTNTSVCIGDPNNDIVLNVVQVEDLIQELQTWTKRVK